MPRCLQCFRAAAKRSASTRQNLYRYRKVDIENLTRCAVSGALGSRETRNIFEEAIWHADAHDLPITLLFGHAHDAMIAADGVLVASVPLPLRQPC